MTKIKKQQASFLAPERLYTLRGFEVASGISTTRRYMARKLGIFLNYLEVGGLKFVRGVDGISFIEALAQHSAGPANTAV